MSERYYPDDIMYQMKQVSSRTLLMNINESNIQDPKERSFVQEYKHIYQQLEETAEIRYEQKLQRLEEKEIFISLVGREREKLRIKREIEGRLALAKWQENEAKRTQEIIDSIKERRKENLYKQTTQSKQFETQAKPPKQVDASEQIQTSKNSAQNSRRIEGVKKFFKEHFWWLTLIPIALFVLVITGVYVYTILAGTVDIWEASNENIGVFILNIVSIPFAILGGINLFRGGWTVLEHDVEKLGIHKYWQGVIYFLITLAGYFAIFWVVANTI